MKQILVLVLCLVIILCIAGCDCFGVQVETPPVTSPSTVTPTTAPTEPIALHAMKAYTRTVYIFQDVEKGYWFSLHLYASNQFSIYDSPVADALYNGSWAMEADNLILRMGSNHQYAFQATDAGFVFLQDRSDPLPEPGYIPDGALFIGQAPETDEIVCTSFAYASEDSCTPVRLFLEGNIYSDNMGFYSFINPTIRNYEGTGYWRVQDGILILNENYLGSGEWRHWYFKIEEDGLIFMAERSDTLPLEAEVPGDARFLRTSEDAATLRAELYTFQPEGSPHKYTLYLFGTQYYHICSTNGYLFEGACYVQDGKLVLIKNHYFYNWQYLFEITDDGLVFIDERSNLNDVLTKLEDGSVFKKDNPCYSPKMALYYKLPAESQLFPIRLYLYHRNSFEYYGPDGNYVYLSGRWSTENGQLTLTYTDGSGQDHCVTLRIAENGLVFTGGSFHVVPEEAMPSIGDKLILVS